MNGTEEKALTTQRAVQGGALVAAEQQRAIAEVQVAMILARSNPRDQIRARDLILQDCTRSGLAERATYTYARGGEDISGPTIRLLEAMAQRFGNVQYGTRELEQHEGDSLMQAYAWDLETNVKREMIFTVPHVRDTKKGPVPLTDARDVYEITANMGARRVRACLQGLIPGDIIDDAVAQVEETLRTKTAVTPERVAKMLATFAGYGVTKDQIEKRIQRHATVEVLTPALLLRLGKIANSLRDGMSSPADWFESDESAAKGTVPLVSDVLAAGTEAKWTQKMVLDFIRERFGKQLTALERGDECVAAVQAIKETAALFEKHGVSTLQDLKTLQLEQAASGYKDGAVASPSPEQTESTPAEKAENAVIDRQLAIQDGEFGLQGPKPSPAPKDKHDKRK